MGIKINQYALERLTFGDDDYYDIDYFDGANYQTAKIKGSTIKAGIQAGITSDNFYSIDGVLTANRTVDGGLFNLGFNNLGKLVIVSDQLGVNNVTFIINNNAYNNGFNIEDTVTSESIFMVRNGEVRINDDYSLPITDGLNNQVLTTDGLGQVSWQTPLKIGNYSQTASSTPITTAPEQTLVGSGVGSLSIPANAFVVGDSFHGKIGGKLNATGGGGRSEIILRIKAGTTVLASTGVFELDTATDQGWECELDFTIASIGAVGQICTNGNFVYTKDGNRTVFGYIFQDVQPIDTTISNTLDITLEWNVINGGDDIYSANFVLYKTY